MIKLKMVLFLLFLAILIMPNSKIIAQQLERTLLSSTGNQIETDDILLEWSIGETVVAFFNNGDISLSQGFHQGNNLVNGILSPPEWTFEISVFPNPTKNYLFLKAKELPDLRIEIYDVFGKLIRKDTWIDYMKKIDLHTLSSGLYLITMKDNEGHFASYKIVKQ